MLGDGGRLTAVRQGAGAGAGAASVWAEQGEAAAAALLALLQDQVGLWPEGQDTGGQATGCATAATAAEEQEADAAAEGWLLFEAVLRASEALGCAAWALRGDGAAAARAQVRGVRVAWLTSGVRQGTRARGVLVGFGWRSGKLVCETWGGARVAFLCIPAMLSPHVR